MITPSFSLTATERVLPSMALDFTTNALDSRVTFTRSTIGTFINSTGVLTTAAINGARFDHNPTTFVPLGLLVEESRTNNLLNSEDLAAATNVAVTNLTLTVNATNFIDGNLVADQVLETAAVGVHAQDLSAFSFVLGTTYTFSIFLKSINGRNCSLFFPATVFTGRQANFDLTAGTVLAAASGVTATIKNYGNGWYRCSITETCAFSAASRPTYILFNGGISYAGDVTKGLFICGYQLEVGAFPTSYIKTAAIVVNRAADVAVMTSTNFSSWYTATAGAAVVWAIPQTATGTRPLLQFDDTTALEIIALRGNVADPELYIVDTLAQAQIDVGTIVANTAYKLSGAWNTNNCAAAKDGGTVGTDVVATIPTPTQLRIGSDGTNYACSWVQKVMYWKQRIINAEVQAFSK